ncbi:MAG: hypothetical protein KF696_07580 [Planctomycetes bacterium]|nr:hypothetical protein [Planctomycetota bacterium]MCW8135412.1 hypothetical protein [Planctomycetota bacterium]
MMHPWDRERTWQETPDQQFAPPAKGGAWVWVIAVVIAVIALFALASSGAGSRGIVAVPVGISLFFMFMFLVNHRREMRHLSAVRRARMQHAEQPQAPQTMAVGGPPPGAPPRDDASLRRIFDRFDLRVIEHCRANTWQPKDISRLLEMARDFVDQPHASALLRAGENEELSRHIDAALERALLQFDIDNNRKGDTRRGHYDFGHNEPPF